MIQLDTNIHADGSIFRAINAIPCLFGFSVVRVHLKGVFISIIIYLAFEFFPLQPSYYSCLKIICDNISHRKKAFELCQV